MVLKAPWCVQALAVTLASEVQNTEHVALVLPSFSSCRALLPSFSVFFVVFTFLFKERVSLCSPDRPKTHSVNQVGLRLAAVLQLQPSKYWGSRCELPYRPCH